MPTTPAYHVEYRLGQELTFGEDVEFQGDPIFKRPTAYNKHFKRRRITTKAGVRIITKSGEKILAVEPPKNATQYQS